VLNDLDGASISDKDRTLYAFIRKMVRDSTSISQEDVDVAHKAGWSDEALYDAITVCSLFQFYNNWIDATGVADMPAFGYEMSGRRLATRGYASAPPSNGRAKLSGPKGKKPTKRKAAKKSKRSKRS
jgi:hypothetical protein